MKKKIGHLHPHLIKICNEYTSFLSTKISVSANVQSKPELSNLQFSKIIKSKTLLSCQE